MKAENLSGQNFNHLTVKYRGENTKSGQSRWWCQCDCGNAELILVQSGNLKNGHTKSCGCLHKEVLYNHKTRKKNTYVDKGDYYQVFLENSEKFFMIDKEDYEKISCYYWSENDNGYIISQSAEKTLRLHRIIMDVYDEKIKVDHIHGKETRNDNRKSNLRICNTQQNAMNHQLNILNTSGVSGITFDKQTNKWMASIWFNNKNIKLGRYVSFDDAVKARKEAEEKYFGEWSYDNSQAM